MSFRKLFESIDSESSMQKLRRECRNYKFVPDKETIDRALEMGIDRFINKEVEPVYKKIINCFPEVTKWTTDSISVLIKFEDGSTKEIDIEDLDNCASDDKLNEELPDENKRVLTNREKLKARFPELDI